MFKIYHKSTNKYLTFPDIYMYQNSITICESKNGRIWKTRGPAISAFKLVTKRCKIYNLDINDFELQEFEMTFKEVVKIN